MSDVDLRPGVVETERHRTAYLEAGPADGPLMIFVHGWPELGLIWRDFAQGFTLPAIAATVDRALYPADEYPVGQWDYWLYHRSHAGRAADTLGADIAATIATFYRRTDPDVVGRPSKFADLRAKGGFFGPAGQAPAMARDETMLSAADHDAYVSAFRQTGFRGANAWYHNDAANAAFAAEAPGFGQLALPVLFVHAAWDTVCDTVRSDLEVPMREDCRDLTEATVEAGHSLRRCCTNTRKCLILLAITNPLHYGNFFHQQ